MTDERNTPRDRDEPNSLTADQLERLLAGGSSGSRELDKLFAAVRRPARPDELRGLAAATAALADPPAPLSRTRRLLARAGAATLATKVLTGAVAAAAVGGVVTAGATDHLPGQHHRPAPSSVTSTPTSSQTTTTSRTPSPTRSGSTSASPSRDGSPSPTRTSAATTSVAPTASTSTSATSSASSSRSSSTSPSSTHAANHRTPGPRSSPGH